MGNGRKRTRELEMIQLTTPISVEAARELQVGDTIEISGYILCGRDAVLPKVLKMIEDGTVGELGVDLHGQVIFHTAVSPAGVGPTSSNKPEIESSIEPLSAAGIKLHLGKGELHPETIAALDKYNAVYAVIPPVTALLGAKTIERKVIAFPELGMEALHLIKVDRYPAVIGAAHGKSIYTREEQP
jgi:fumarate hydratase subunit beta